MICIKQGRDVLAFYTIFEQLCSERGVTPTQVARDNGITQQTVSHWKTRDSTPKAQTVQKLADYFGVSVDYLLGNVSEPFFYLDNQRIIREINSYSDDDLIPQNRIAEALLKLNEDGQRVAAERVEELTEIPRYRATPRQEAGETASAPPEGRYRPDGKAARAALRGAERAK